VLSRGADTSVRTMVLYSHVQVWAVWEALGVSEEERGKFRNQVAALSTKPDAALQVEPLHARAGSP
jgi:hypothetical protein